MDAEGELLSATKAAARFGLSRPTLIAAHKAGRVRCGREIRRPGLGPNGVGYVFPAMELEKELAALPECGEGGCHRAALGPSGGCEHHGHVLSGARARGVKRPDLGPKISAAKKGKPRPDLVEPMRARMTKYAPEDRSCLVCDRPLGRILGWVIRNGGGRFCASCVAGGEMQRWIWEHIRGVRGPTLLECAICGRPVERYDSQIANADANGWRFVCEVCTPDYRRYRLSAFHAVKDANPKAWPAPPEWVAALERTWQIAAEFETATLSRWPKTKGRRPPILIDFVIATFFRRGFSDKAILELLNAALSVAGRRIPGLKEGERLRRVKYVTTRRQRTQLKRPKG